VTQKKSAGKSARPRGRPFEQGLDLRRGRGPLKGAPTAGRPPSRVRLLAQELTDRLRLVEVLAHIGAGDVYEEIGRRKDGKPIYGETRNADRINAIKVVLAYADGLPTQTIEAKGDRPLLIIGDLETYQEAPPA